jgi:hypothetical protein
MEGWFRRRGCDVVAALVKPRGDRREPAGKVGAAVLEALPYDEPDPRLRRRTPKGDAEIPGCAARADSAGRQRRCRPAQVRQPNPGSPTSCSAEHPSQADKGTRCDRRAAVHRMVGEHVEVRLRLAAVRVLAEQSAPKGHCTARCSPAGDDDVLVAHPPQRACSRVQERPVVARCGGPQLGRPVRLIPDLPVTHFGQRPAGGRESAPDCLGSGKKPEKRRAAARRNLASSRRSGRQVPGIALGGRATPSAQRGARTTVRSTRRSESAASRTASSMYPQW